MTVRGFVTTDILNTATGAASGCTYGTVAALIKYASTGDYQAVAHLHNNTNTFLASMLNMQTTGILEWYSVSSSTTGATSLSAGTWYLLVVRKPTGSATPRFSIYNYTNTTWTHVAGSGALSDHTAPGASGTIRFNYQDAGDWFGSRVAARAVWSNNLPWTADASGDTAIQNAGLHTAAANWLSANPSAFWLFNQASVATPVEDLSTTGTADQTSITGTTVVNGDDPPGFDFSLGGAPTPATLRFVQSMYRLA